MIAGRPLRVVSRRVDFSIHRHGFGLSIIKYRHFADAFVAVSEAVRAALIRDGVPGEMIHVVHSGVKIPSPGESGERGVLNRMLGTNGTATIVGCVGNLVGHKGHRYLVEAACELVKRMPELRFVVLGEGRLRRDLESRIRRGGLSGKFFLPGHEPSASRLIRAFNVFVMPSVQEGLGTSVLDAMAAGVPVVATRAGGIPEVVEDNETGLLARPRDARSLAEALEKILRERNLTRRLARSAKKKVAARFTVKNMVAKQARIYRKLLSERG
jgi:glycosyltransferase involved in cell wall biosynthesis